MKNNKNNIFIVGYMGSGKTSVGRALSDLLSRNFIDMDQVIEEEQNSTISQIFMKYGEHSFRNYEAELLDKIVAGTYESAKDKGAIISCGGGLILDEENCKILRNEYVIWLDSDPNIMFERIKNNSNLPNAYWHVEDEDGRRQMFIKQYQQRKNLYADVADITMDSGNKDIISLANEIKNKI